MSARFRAGPRRWSEPVDALMRARYPHEPTAHLARDLRRTAASVYARADLLGLSKSDEYLASPHACRLRRGDHVGAATRFRKGQTPGNKGLRRPGWGPGRMKETQFRKGERRGVAVRLYQPIGTERISKDGYRGGRSTTTCRCSGAGAPCICCSGRRHTGRSRRATRSCFATATRPTFDSITWRASRAVN